MGITGNVGATAMAMNAALVEQAGLPDVLDCFGDEMCPDMIDGFHLAHAGQVTHLSWDPLYGAEGEPPASDEIRISLATDGLRLENETRGTAAYTEKVGEIFKRIHDTRMKVDPGWFTDFAARNPVTAQMPATVEQSLMLYWSVLLENPSTLRAEAEAKKGLFSQPGFYERSRSGLEMALASFASLLPYYSGAEAGAGLAVDTLYLRSLGNSQDVATMVTRIVERLESMDEELMKTAFVDMRSAGGMWSLANHAATAVPPRSPFHRGLPQFDPLGG